MGRISEGFSWHPRGPGKGDGRGPGRPWRGIVEETPALWIQWFVDAAQRAAWVLPMEVRILGRHIGMESVDLPYGPRWYWLCPECGRRCDTIFVLRDLVGCRLCLRLGYRSQAQRASSVRAALDMVYAREPEYGDRYQLGPIAKTLVDDLRAEIGDEIRRLFAEVEIYPGDDVPAVPEQPDQS